MRYPTYNEKKKKDEMAKFLLYFDSGNIPKNGANTHERVCIIGTVREKGDRRVAIVAYARIYNSYSQQSTGFDVVFLGVKVFIDFCETTIDVPQ